MRGCVRTGLLCSLTLLAFVGSAARADLDDLSGGVFIVHAPAGVQYQDPPPTEGWCGLYASEHAIACCGDQNPRIEAGEVRVWFVLSAWEEEKRFCGVRFGLGEYDSDQFLIVDHGPCDPGGGTLQIGTPGWPGPNEGISFVATGMSDWSGNYIPVYFFAARGYAQQIVPLAPDATAYPEPFAGWAACQYPWPEYTADCLGALGVGIEGLECGGETLPSPAEPSRWGAIKALYR